jgi:hypothetical protein
MGKVYVGDVGTEIILDCGTNISAATAISMSVRKPSGAVVVWSAVASGTNSIKHVTEAGDLSVPGVYKVHAKVALPTWTGTGSAAEFSVYRDFD